MTRRRVSALGDQTGYHKGKCNRLERHTTQAICNVEAIGQRNLVSTRMQITTGEEIEHLTGNSGCAHQYRPRTASPG